MKLQLNTKDKTIKIAESVKVSELIETLRALLPKDWKEFTLEVNKAIYEWKNPIIIEGKSWWDYPFYSLSSTSTDPKMNSILKKTREAYELKFGVFNLEV